MRRAVFSWNEQVHELPFAAEGAAHFAKTGDVAVLEGFAGEAQRRQLFDSGRRRYGIQSQPCDIVVECRPGIEQIAAGLRARRGIEPDRRSRDGTDEGEQREESKPQPSALVQGLTRLQDHRADPVDVIRPG